MTARRTFALETRRWVFALTAALIPLGSLAGCGSEGSAGASPEGGVTAGGAAARERAASGTAASVASSVAFAETRPVPAPAAQTKAPTPREDLGRRIFFDEKLSTPPGTSCASCHDPRFAFSGNNGSTNGVAAGSRPGHFSRRNTPSVLYVKYVPAFHFALEDDDDVNPAPLGGLSWSGRADSVAEFSRLPLLDPDEMNNASDAEVARKARAADYAKELAALYPGALDSPAAAVRAVGDALQAYLASDAMAPFSSRFDDYLHGTGKLSELEMRGLAAFKSAEKGACDGCHRFAERSRRTERSLFTDFGYDAVAVPRNREIPANGDPHAIDLGLCERKQAAVPSSAPQWCASFRTPSLRNVAVRKRFMHNGAFTRLRDVVAFYASRTTDPSRWYPLGPGGAGKFDDVPPRYRANVNVSSLPYNRAAGDKPALDDEDIDAIVAFLGTLTDKEYLEAPP
jgi:cytochrome c peroxidase